MTISTAIPTTRGITDTTIRVAILTAPLGGLLKLIGNLGTFDSVGYGIPQASEAATAAGPGYLLGQLAGSVLPTVLTPFWVFALFAYAAPRIRARRTLAAAVTAWVVGAGFTLAALGVVTYAITVLGHAHYAGDSAAMNVVDSFFTWPTVGMFLPAILVPIGSVLFAIAVWPTAALPRTCVTGLAVATLLISAPGPIHSLHLAGGILTLACGTWLAYHIHHSLSAGSIGLMPNARRVAQ
jgi:hypothetical protein